MKSTTIQNCSNVLTGDVTCVYGYVVETKDKSPSLRHSESIELKKLDSSIECIGYILPVIFDFKGMRHNEFLSQGLMINKNYRLRILCHVRKVIRQKHPDFWHYNLWQLHHDNAPAHTFSFVHKFLTKP